MKDTNSLGHDRRSLKQRRAELDSEEAAREFQRLTWLELNPEKCLAWKYLEDEGFI